MFLRPFVSMSFCSICMFSTYMVLCLWACLSVCLFGCYPVPVIKFANFFTVIVSFDFVTQSLFSSITTHHFLFHVFIRPLGNIEFQWHCVPLPDRCMGKLFKVSTNYFVLFVLKRVTFCFCFLFKLSLATTTGIDII